MTAPRSLYGLRRPGRDRLAAILHRGSIQPTSYDADAVGATVHRPGSPPAGHHLLRAERSIGHGRARFAEARAAIEAWAGHRRAGAIVHPADQPIEKGGDVALALRVWPLWVTASCRIVEVVDEPDRFGFAYGTLDHHPESGEESFLVRRDPATDEVRLEIVAFSRPTSLPARLGGPFGRLFQRFMAGRYLDGFQHPTSPGQGPITSIRWWFEDRENGRLTVAQFPNWPLFAIAAVTLLAEGARRLPGTGTAIDEGAGLAVTGLWLYWGGDELVRGVNPWRRLLGAGVVGWQVVRLLTR